MRLGPNHATSYSLSTGASDASDGSYSRGCSGGSGLTMDAAFGAAPVSYSIENSSGNWRGCRAHAVSAGTERHFVAPEFGNIQETSRIDRAPREVCAMPLHRFSQEKPSNA